jgi:Transcriptional regulator
VQSVTHASALLHAIASARTPPNLSTLARRLELSKPATYNLLNTLIAERLVRKDASGRYRLDWGMYELAASVGTAQAIRRASRPSLHRLAEETGGATLLSILENDSVLYLDRGQVEHSFSMIANTGRRSPLHTNASGKVLLASMSPGGIRSYLQRPLKARTTATITEPARLILELDKVKAEGYGTCWGEQEPRLSSVAVPIFIPDRRVCASLALAVPTERFRRLSPSQLAEKLRHAAGDISSEMERVLSR